MKPRSYLLPVAVAVFLLLTVLLFPNSSFWETRATLCVQGEAAGTVPKLLESSFFTDHLREISDFDGQIQAKALPGTTLVEITLREDSPVHAQAGMDALLNRLSPVMGYFSQDFSLEIILEPNISEKFSQQDRGILLLAGTAVLLLLMPVPKFRGELDLADLLRRFWKLTRRRWYLVLAFLLLGTSGYAICHSATYVPVYEASAVISLGDYNGETAPLLPYVVKGLLGSDLLAQQLPPGCEISGEAAAESNLFTFTALAATHDAAQTALDTVLSRWEELSRYALIDLPLETHQLAPAVLANPCSLPGVITKGAALGLFSWLCIAFAAILFRQNIDTAPCKAYNESQS